MIKSQQKRSIVVAVATIVAVMSLGIGYAISQTMMPPRMMPMDPGMTQENQLRTQPGQDQMRRSMNGYIAPLSGQEEVPPVTTDANGRAEVSFDMQNNVIHYALVVSNIDNLKEAHIHLGGTSENGPIVAWLLPAANQPGSIPGTTEAMIVKGTITNEDLIGSMAGRTISDLEREINSGNAYVNVHTSQNTNGEIRGQLSRQAQQQENPAQE